jgi:DNA polymerase III subunit chi
VPRVDFYVLSEEAPDARLRTACRLIEKAFDQGLRVYAQTQTLSDAQRLDEQLWTFNDHFIPHEVVQGAAASHPRVLILLGDQPAPASHRQLLINLANTLPADIESYERIVEIVAVDPEAKRWSRERYKTYRERGCGLETHNL